MKLYLYSYPWFGDDKVSCRKIEADEKPKSYQIKKCGGWIDGSVILKSQIGIIDNNGHSLYLTENNINKAIKIFISYFKSDIENRKNVINNINLTIKNMEEQLHE